MPNSTSAAYADPHPDTRAEAPSAESASVIRSPDAFAAIQLTEVAHRLGHRWALRGISLRVEPGEVVAIVGPNGSGKTTLLRVVATSLIPLRGSGLVFGNDLVRDADAVREVVGMLGHATGLYDDLTATENLVFAMRMYGRTLSRSAIDATLDMVGMLAHAGERVRILSSGMRRRIALARVLLRRPRLLLLDEPYNTFDATGVEVVDQLIRETASVGGAALVVTHDLGRTGGGYDQVVPLKDGRVVRERSLSFEGAP